MFQRESVAKVLWFFLSLMVIIGVTGTLLVTLFLLVSR